MTFIPSFLQKQVQSDLEENPRRAVIDYDAFMILNFPPITEAYNRIKKRQEKRRSGKDKKQTKVTKRESEGDIPEEEEQREVMGR